MATFSVRMDDNVRNEANHIATSMGLTLNGIINVLVRHFNKEKGFSFEPRVEADTKPDLFKLETVDVNRLCEEAVQNRDDITGIEYTTMMDEDGNIFKQFKDGRVEYVLL